MIGDGRKTMGKREENDQLLDNQDRGQDYFGQDFDPYALIDPHDKQARARRRYARQQLQKRRQIKKQPSGSKGAAEDELMGAAGGELVGAAGCGAAGARDGADAAGGGAAVLIDSPTGTAAPVRLSRHRLALAAVALVAVVIVAGFGGYLGYDMLRVADISAYGKSGISISGLTDDDFIVTPEQLNALELVSLSATGVGMGEGGQSKTGVVKAYGPTLSTFLAQYGYKLEDFRSITFYCKDGYSSVIRPSRLEDPKPDIILSTAADKEPLEPYQRPLRLVIPGGSTGSWCFGILRIEFILDDGSGDLSGGSNGSGGNVSGGSGNVGGGSSVGGSSGGGSSGGLSNGAPPPPGQSPSAPAIGDAD
jgi:hypothetical protein